MVHSKRRSMIVGGIRSSTGALGPDLTLLPSLRNRAHPCLAASNPNHQLTMLCTTSDRASQLAGSMGTALVPFSIGTIVGECIHNVANTSFRGNKPLQLCRNASAQLGHLRCALWWVQLVLSVFLMPSYNIPVGAWIMSIIRTLVDAPPEGVRSRTRD